MHSASSRLVTVKSRPASFNSSFGISVAKGGSVAPGGVRKLIAYSPPASDSQPER
jgi:hypothetical protein